jgi:hypothetical protein
MKTEVILFLFFTLLPTNSGKADELLKIMSNYWAYEPENNSASNDCSCPNYEKNNEENENFYNESPGENSNGEHYSWDNIYLEPNYPEIIY